MVFFPFVSFLMQNRQNWMNVKMPQKFTNLRCCILSKELITSLIICVCSKYLLCIMLLNSCLHTFLIGTWGTIVTNSLGMPFTHSLGIVLAAVDGQYLWLFKWKTQFFSQKGHPPRSHQHLASCYYHSRQYRYSRILPTLQNISLSNTDSEYTGVLKC